MSARAKLLARAVTARLLAPVGTPPVSAALAALAVAYHLAALGLERVAGAGAGPRLASSLAFEALGVALVVDACVSLLRALPVQLDGAGRLALRRPDRRGLGGGLLRLGYFLLAMAFTASLLARDVFSLRVAEGEEYTGAAGQLTARLPPRALSPGPFPLRFELARVEGRLDAGGAPRAERAELVLDGERRSLRPGRPLWLGFGRFVALSSFGLVPRYELRDARGVPVESAFVKLELLPPGKRDAFELEAAPLRVVVALAPEDRPGAGADLASPRLVARAYRGRLDLGEAVLAGGRSLPVEQQALAFPEVRRWAELRMIRDPGIPLAALALALALAGLALRALPLRPRGAR